MTKRCDQPICIEYEECKPNKYGEIRKKIVGGKKQIHRKENHHQIKKLGD